MNTKIGRGSLRAVEAKSEAHPAYKGSLEIDGRKYWLSGWKKFGTDGQSWLSLSVETADPPAEERQPAPRSYAQRRDSAF